MKEDLETLRNEIQKIDEKMQEFFLKRMELVKKINDFKIEHDLPLEDKSVEKTKYEHIKKSSNPLIKKYYLEVQTSLVETSKKYQNELRQIAKK